MVYQNERNYWNGCIYSVMDSYNIRTGRIMKIYPSLPAHPIKDFYEMIEPLDIIELNCTCNLEEMCQSCKQYFENDQVQTLLEKIEE